MLFPMCSLNPHFLEDTSKSQVEVKGKSAFFCAVYIIRFKIKAQLESINGKNSVIKTF